MSTLHLYSNYHISKQVHNIRKGDYIVLENGMSRKRWAFMFRYNKIDEASLDITYITQEDFINLDKSFDKVLGIPNVKQFAKFLDKAATLSNNIIFTGIDYLDTSFKSRVRVSVRKLLEKYGLQEHIILEDKSITYYLDTTLPTKTSSLMKQLSDTDILNEKAAEYLEEQANSYGGFTVLGQDVVKKYKDNDKLVKALTLTNSGAKFITVPISKTYLFENSDKVIFTHRRFGVSDLICYKPNIKNTYLYVGSGATAIQVNDDFTEDEFRNHFDNESCRRAFRHYLRGGKSKLNNWMFQKFPKKKVDISNSCAII